ncbi:hypothetical protein A0J61_10696 [Choanephora cucurbitarum]|uniref:Peptidase A2 domain-containing protein n=1 Tax=Choanephora cucurbitarum TaxID=101091 RepID=A0A1C7MWJ9_9FUNG|nr:hypothetical protein A0J61_10696 [Choanephora cucurbitarum]
MRHNQWNLIILVEIKIEDKQGRPVCGHCQQLHRNIDCKQEPRHSKSQVNAVELSNNTVNLNNPTTHSVDTIHASSAINHVQQIRLSDNTAPILDLVYNGTKVTVLRDTGAQINCMSYASAKELKLTIDTSATLSHHNVDMVSNFTMGTVKLKLFGEIVKFNVLEKMTQQIIIGSQTVHKWRTIWDFDNLSLAYIINNQKYAIKYRFRQRRSINAGIRPNLSKVKPILALLAPTNLKELESILGVFGVYQRFLSQVQITVEPLTTAHGV